MPNAANPRPAPQLLKTRLLGGAAICTISLALTAQGAGAATAPTKTANGSFTATYSSDGSAPSYIPVTPTQIKKGNFAFNTSSEQISLNAHRTILDWTGVSSGTDGYKPIQSFLNSYQTLDFIFNDRSDIVVNRIHTAAGSGGTLISGKITGYVGSPALGQIGGNIWFLDPNGLSFTGDGSAQTVNNGIRGATITAGGVLAAAADFKNDSDFLTGAFIGDNATALKFIGGAGTVTVQSPTGWTTATITTNGMLALIGQHVRTDSSSRVNNGVPITPTTLKSSSGEVVLGVATDFSLRLKTFGAGDLDLLSFQVDKASSWTPPSGYGRTILQIDGVVNAAGVVAFGSLKTMYVVAQQQRALC